MSVIIYINTQRRHQGVQEKRTVPFSLPPNCTEQGYTIHYCLESGCTGSYWSDYVPPRHTYEDNPTQVKCTNCPALNPAALSGFSISVSGQLDLDTYPSTTLIPNTAPGTATGSISYSVSPAGVIGLGSGNSSAISTSFGTSLSVNALSKGSATITAIATDSCGQSISAYATVTVISSVVPTPTDIVFPYSSYSIDAGKSVSIGASILPAEADQGLTWSSSNTAVATVADGGVYGVAPGGATITATSVANPSLSRSVEVIVNAVKVSKITFATSSINLGVAGSGSVACTIEPSNATNQALVWKSDDETVAVVNSSGIVYGIKPGAAVITATAADGSGASAYYKVVVSGSTPTATPAPSTLVFRNYYPGAFATGNNYSDTSQIGYRTYLRGLTYTRPGYTQTGWSLSYYGYTKDYVLNAEILNTSDLTLYPFWSTNPSVPLKVIMDYNENLGTVYLNAQKISTNHYTSLNYGESVTFTVAAIDQYYPSYVKVGGRNINIVNNSFTVKYSDLQASDQICHVEFISIYARPKTGDGSYIGLWAALCIVTSSMLVTMYATEKKRKNTK